MKFLVVGCSFRTAPLALRERLAFAAEATTPALHELRRHVDICEAMLLSTCNRVEVYAAVTRAQHAAREIRRLLSNHSATPLQELDPALYQFEDQEALLHIFRVAASLDAMVIGETQVVGQVKEAYAVAARAETVGPLLSRCLHRAFATGKRIRHETAIGRYPVSVSSVAAQLAGRIFGDLAHTEVLVLGAGEMAELAVRHLLGDGAASIRVLNRTHERAVELAAQLGARASRFEELPAQLVLADIVICSTGSAQPILSRELLSGVMRQRKQRPLFLVDIAVPRDVEAEVARLANVYLFNIDDLEQVVQENLLERRREARQGERIIRAEVSTFLEWLRKQDAVPVIKQLRQHFATIVRAETARTANALQLQDEGQRKLLESMADSIVNKLLHDPSVELKNRAAQPDGRFLSQAARSLFHLQAFADEREPSSGEQPQVQLGVAPLAPGGAAKPEETK